MDPASIVSSIETCIKYGTILIQIIQHFRHAENEVRLLAVRVEGSWIRIRQQLGFIEKIADSLDEEHRLYQDEILRILAIKLSEAETGIENVIRRTERRQPRLAFLNVRRGKYVLQQSALNAVIIDLEEWQRRFDPSWYLILLIANPIIDSQLASPSVEQAEALTLSAHDNVLEQTRPGQRSSPLAIARDLRDALRPQPRKEAHMSLGTLNTEIIDLPYSRAKITQRESQWFVVDRYDCQSGPSIKAQVNDVRRLAQKLKSVDPWTFGLLSCKGFIKVQDGTAQQPTGFDFVFRVPESKESLKSLRQDLLNGEKYSLSRRVLMAKELAKSVGYVHNLNFVHKHICPETILLFQDGNSRFSTFLIGFNSFRSASGGTNFAGDAEWERNLYRHPTRQGEMPEARYSMQHDIYSLGVCLLEIGLWQPFVSYSTDPTPVPRPGESYNQFVRWLKAIDGHIPVTRDPPDPEIVAKRLKDYFVHLALTELPLCMGDTYRLVVVTCLTCLDEGNDFEDVDDTDDEEGIHVAVRFMKLISTKLDEIHV